MAFDWAFYVPGGRVAHFARSHSALPFPIIVRLQISEVSREQFLQTFSFTKEFAH